MRVKSSISSIPSTTLSLSVRSRDAQSATASSKYAKCRVIKPNRLVSVGVEWSFSLAKSEKRGWRSVSTLGGMALREEGLPRPLRVSSNFRIWNAMRLRHDICEFRFTILSGHLLSSSSRGLADVRLYTEGRDWIYKYNIREVWVEVLSLISYLNK